MMLRTAVTFAAFLSIVAALQQQATVSTSYETSPQNHEELQNNVTFTNNLLQSVQDRHDEMIKSSRDKKEVLQFLNTRNIIKTMFRLFFGSNEESLATSKQVLGVFVKVCGFVCDSLQVPEF